MQLDAPAPPEAQTPAESHFVKEELMLRVIDPSFINNYRFYYSFIIKLSLLIVHLNVASSADFQWDEPVTTKVE